MTVQREIYQAVPGWGRGPDAPNLGLVSGVAADSQGRVYVFCRVPQAVVHVFDRSGRFLRSWDQHRFVEPHMLWIGPDNRVYATDTGDHTVRIFTTDGELLQTIGTPGQTGERGKPFNRPTRAVVGPSGTIYVSDGYGQEYVHAFSPDGELIRTWGGPGTAPGEFALPHSIWVDQQERIYVVDRENDRLQIFDAGGAFISQITGLSYPHDVYVTADGTIVLTECARRARPQTTPYYETMPRQPISEWSLDGTLIRRWGDSGAGPGQFLDCPHAFCVDLFGDIYIGEVITHNRLQKFTRGATG